MDEVEILKLARRLVEEYSQQGYLLTVQDDGEGMSPHGRFSVTTSVTKRDGALGQHLLKTLCEQARKWHHLPGIVGLASRYPTPKGAGPAFGDGLPSFPGMNGRYWRKADIG